MCSPARWGARARGVGGRRRGFVASSQTAGWTQKTFGAHAVEPGKLAVAVGRARQGRLAYVREEKVLGTVSVASPVLGPGDALVADIAVVARVGTRVERLGPAVRTAALGVPRSMLRPTDGPARSTVR